MTEVGLGLLPVRRDLSDRILALFSASRPHQWLKNVLLCAPAIAAHRLDWPTGRNVLVAFVSLSLVASGSYILNDLLDLEADRQHPRKRLRALAAGRISTPWGVSHRRHVAGRRRSRRSVAAAAARGGPRYLPAGNDSVFASNETTTSPGRHGPHRVCMSSALSQAGSQLRFLCRRGC